MGNNWPTYPLEKCMEAIIDYRGKTPNKTSSGVPLITAKIVKGGRILPVQEYIAESEYDTWMRRGHPQKGDILITTEAPLGEVAQLDGRKVALAQRLITLRGKKGFLDNTFLKYLLQSHEVQHQIDGRASGTTVSGIKQSELRKVLLPIPDFPEQRAIAHILGSLDDKIELNRQMNETLEAMAQALFKSWFIDFDPVIDNALAAGNPIPEELQARAALRESLGDARKPLPDDIRNLFPGEFEFTEEMDWIPKGWKAVPAENVLDINPRVQLKKNTTAPFVDMKALPTSGFSITEVSQKAYSGGAKFNNGDVLLARITPCLENGKTGIVDFLDGDETGFGSTEFIVLRGKGAVTTPYVACLSRLASFRDHCIQSMVGSSGRQRVQNACFSNFYLAVPPDNDLLSNFDLLVRGNFDRITEQTTQNRSLTQLRDNLLPKLLSSEIRIQDAEKLVEVAV